MLRLACPTRLPSFSSSSLAHVAESSGPRSGSVECISWRWRLLGPSWHRQGNGISAGVRTNSSSSDGGGPDLEERGPPLPFSRGWAAGLAQMAPSGGNARRGGGGPGQRLLGALALLRSPNELDGEGLGRAATAAAREGLGDVAWWRALAARARELAPDLAMHDASLVLNGMARARRLDKGLVEALLPRIRSNLVYLTSAHLAMLASAISKADISDARFNDVLTRELKARLLEFHSAMELTMIVNAVSKLRVTDDNLYQRFVTHIQSRMAYEAFQVRDLSVIVAALVRVQCIDAPTMSRFADCAVQTLPQATSLELAKLMHACMSVSCTVDDFFSAIVLHNREQSLSMDPSGLSAAAFAFGQCFEVAQVPHLRYLRSIFRSIRLASVASLPLFLPREIVSLLRTYARWQITFECDQLRKVADRMRATKEHFDIESSVSALYSLALLMQRALRSTAAGPTSEARWQAASEAARSLLGPVWASMREGRLDLATVQRVVEASLVLRAGDDATLARAVAAAVVRRRAELDGPTGTALYELLAEAGCPPEADVMLLLADSGALAQ